MKKIVCAVMAVAVALSVAGCSEASRKSSEISREANNFDRMRRITVINTRTDTIIWQLTGKFATFQNSSDLDVVVSIGDDEFAKYYFDLNDWTTYVVEDLVGEHLPENYHEIKFLPKEGE